MRVLVAGATGYIGSLLVPRLVGAGHQVRTLARDPRRARSMLPPECEIVAGDVLQPATLPSALAQTEAAYYLVHSLNEDEFSFEELDRQAARNFAQAAAAAGMQRVIYLG